MKTLINKANPQIRITSPEIELWVGTAYVVGQHLSGTKDVRDVTLVIPKKRWTLVEEEPKQQTSKYLKEPDYDKQVVKKMSKELAKIITDQIVEPVDLEKALNELDNAYFDLDGIAVKGATYYLTVNDLKDIARDFYELGLNARKEN